MAKKPVEHIITVGADFGFGVTKAVAVGHEPAVFPSLVGRARAIKFKADQTLAKYPGDLLTDEDGQWFVGGLCESQIPASEQLKLRGRGAGENEFRIRLLKATLGKLLAGTVDGSRMIVHLATGLPVDHMRDADALRESLTGEFCVQSDQAQFVADVVDVMVLPQPYGTLYASLLTSDGCQNPKYLASRSGVVDLGTFTVDLALDEDGEFIDAASGSIESGVHVAQTKVAEYIEAEFRQKPKLRDVDQALLTGQFKAKGDAIDLQDIVNAALEPIRMATLNLMAEKWGQGLDVDVIHLAGGGAPLVEKVIREHYPQARMGQNPQLTNAIGYLQYALWAQRA